MVVVLKGWVPEHNLVWIAAPKPMPELVGIRPYRPDIDGLRGVAILAIVLTDAGFGAVPGGQTGISVFFVVSGYLVTAAMRADRARLSIADFYERRARRLLPALLAVVGASLVAGALLLQDTEVAGLSRSALAALLMASNFWLARVGEAAGATAPLAHLWPLSVLAQLYVLLPIGAALCAWSGNGRRSAPMNVALATLASLVVALRAGPADGLLLQHRLWEFGVGSLLAMLPLAASAPRRLAEPVAAVGAVAVIAPVFLMPVAPAGASGLMAIPAVAGSAALLWANRSGTRVGGLLGAAPLVFVGMISYSLYLWHWPVLVFARAAWGTLAPGATLACLGLALVLATLSWYFIEQPFRYATGPIRSRGAVLAASLAGVATLAALATALGAGSGLAGAATPAVAYAGAGSLAPCTPDAICIAR